MNLRVNDRQEKGVQKRGNHTSENSLLHTRNRVGRRD